jgi:hypothetical protein
MLYPIKGENDMAVKVKIAVLEGYEFYGEELDRTRGYVLIETASDVASELYNSGVAAWPGEKESPWDPA